MQYIKLNVQFDELTLYLYINMRLLFLIAL